METIRMSGKERRRLELLARVRDQEMKLIQATTLMNLSYRQAKRVWRRFRLEGDAGLLHRSRGRPSGRGVAPAKRQGVLELYKKEYWDFGPTLAAEKLTERGFAVNHETLRRWLLQAYPREKRCSGARHRQWRERKAQLGEMVQMDGSEHDWFEGRRERATLMVMIDDATNRVYARFFEGETTEAAMESFGRYSRRYGLPCSLYVDRDSIYRTDRQASVAEQVASQEPLTQFGRAMKELGVEIKLAYSPQAKGRVERENGVLQDRLVKEMRLAGICDLASANRFLEKKFLPALNRKFARSAAKEGDLHRRVSTAMKLDEVLSIQESRVVAQDWTVRWGGRYYQISSSHAALRLPGKRIVARQRLDGQRRLVYRGEALRWRELPARPMPQPKERRLAIPPSGTRQAWKPAANHPWRAALRAAARRGLAPVLTPKHNNNKNNNNGCHQKGDISNGSRKGTF